MFRMVTPPIIRGHVTVITESGTGETVSATFRCRGAITRDECTSKAHFEFQTNQFSFCDYYCETIF
jgi:ketosteroid isomerase-like protein